MQIKRSKSQDMNLHWLKDKESREQLLTKLEKRFNNKVDYFTKHHTINNHKISYPTYVRDTINSQRLQLNTIYINNIHIRLQECVNYTSKGNLTTRMRTSNESNPGGKFTVQD